MFRRQNVRPSEQHVGGQSGGDVPGQGHAGQIPGKQIRTNGRSDKKIQAVFILRDKLRVAGDVSPGRLHLGLRPAKIQLGGHSNFVAFPNHVVGRFLRFQR